MDRKLSKDKAFCFVYQKEELKTNYHKLSISDF